MTPIPTNSRNSANAIFNKDLAAEPWYGLEQEYTLFNLDKRTPLGWPKGGYPGAQGPYYCCTSILALLFSSMHILNAYTCKTSYKRCIVQLLVRITLSGV
jgi:glutamine synthetase